MDNLTVKMIEELISFHTNYKVKKYKHFYKLYKGKHAILNKTVSSPSKPNNKIVNSFYSQIVDTATGYFMGVPVVINHNIDQDIQDMLDEVFIENDKDDLFGEVAKEASIKGRSYILVYQNEMGETKLVRVKPEEMIVKRNEANELEYAIRYYYVHDPLKKEHILHVEVYDRKTITYYNSINGSLSLDTSKSVNPAPHIFKAVPVVEFLNNEEKMGDLEKMESLVESYDKVLSYSADEQEAYRNAYMVIRNMIPSEETLAKFKEQGVIEIGEDGEVSFLKKDIQVESLEKHLDRIEKNIHKFSQVPDLSDENFAGNLSGVAIRFKILGLENKTIMKERKFTKAIRQMLKLLTVPIYVKTGKQLKVVDVDIQYTRNLPNNLQEIVDTVTKLNGVVDQETLLSLLPFINDVSAVIEKLNKEQEGEAGQYPNFHSSSDDRQKVSFEDDNVAI